MNAGGVWKATLWLLIERAKSHKTGKSMLRMMIARAIIRRAFLTARLKPGFELISFLSCMPP